MLQAAAVKDTTLYHLYFSTGFDVQKKYLGLLLGSKFTKSLLGGLAGQLTKKGVCQTVSYTEFV